MSTNPRYGVKTFHKVVFGTMKTVKEFKKAEEELINKKLYYSVYAEKKRLYSLSKKTKVQASKQEEAYKSLIMSFLKKVNSSLKFENLYRTTYITNNKTKEICKLEEYTENKSFTFIRIKDDVIYYSCFYLKYLPNKPFGIIITINRILAPFTLDSFSLKAFLGKWDFKKRFKLYYQEIEEGLSKWKLS